MQRIQLPATLGWDGFRTPKYDNGELINDTPHQHRDEIDAAVNYLRTYARSSARPGRSTSYGYKHQVERAIGKYICNGALIAAAIEVGFRVEQIALNNPNALVYAQVDDPFNGMIYTDAGFTRCAQELAAVAQRVPARSRTQIGLYRVACETPRLWFDAERMSPSTWTRVARMAQALLKEQPNG